MKMSQITNLVLRQGYRRIGRRVLFNSYGGDPERIHEVMIAALARMPKAGAPKRHNPVTVAGISFPNRVGLASGLDKDGLAAHTWSRFGFGFAELGTVTAIGQPGNPKPRLFRLRASQAIINRMGFNNLGAEAMAQRLESKGLRRGSGPIPLGISIGKSKVVDLADATADYLTSLRAVGPYADYIAINVSSPNTPGLRSLQDSRELFRLVSALRSEAAVLSSDPVPIFVKLAPDLTPKETIDIARVVEDADAAGLIATNTTLRRDGLNPADAALATEAGGLSGRPLTRRSRECVARLREATELPIIGVGGIMTPGDAAAMLEAGADLVQVYTGFIYEGAALVHGINHLI